MNNGNLLELCDKKIKLSQELQNTLNEEDLEKVRELILIEKDILKYVLTKDQKEEIEIIWKLEI